jgi:hypothetical protein
MDDEVHIVHQDPLALAASFDRVRINAKLALEPNLDFVSNSNVLTIIGAIADEEVIGETALGWVEGEDADVFSFLVFGGGGGGEQ